MARYRMVMHTDAYKCARCSKKNWEPGTRNDYMLAINGSTRSLHNMREVMWQLELFHGNSFVMSEYSNDNPEENYGLSDQYMAFLKKNTIKYHDQLCGLDRTIPDSMISIWTDVTWKSRKSLRRKNKSRQQLCRK